MSENAKTTVVVAVIGAAGAIGAALIPIFLSDRSPPAPPPPATASVSAPAPEATKERPGPAATKKAGPPPAVKAAIVADHARLQGRWRVIAQMGKGKEASRDDLAQSNQIWTFDGDELTLRRQVDGKTVVQNQGTFKIRPVRMGPKHFDFAGASPEGRQVEFIGIYEFEDEYLKVCFRIHRPQADAVPDRPDAFPTEADRSGLFFKLRRAGRE